MSISIEEKQEIRGKSAKPMLWLGIVAMCMFFGGLTSAYIVRSGDPGWLSFDLPVVFYASTLSIIASSLTLLYASYSAQKDNYSGVKIGMVFTLILGLAFVYFQFSAWGSLIAQNIFLTGKESNAAGQYLYILTLAHLLHLAGGIIMLIYVCIKSFKRFYHSKNLLGLQLCSIYWHFLDVLWIYLFLFMYLTH